MSLRQFSALGGAVDGVGQAANEEPLEATETPYRVLFELGADALVLVQNESGQILEANAAAEECYGFPRERLIEMRNVDLSAEPEATRAATRRAAAHVPLRFHRRHDGSVFPVEIRARHFQWRGESVHLASIRDIAEQLRVHRAIEQERVFLRSVVDADPHFIYAEDAHGRLTLTNRSLAQSLGLHPEQMLGSKLSELAGSPDLKQALFAQESGLIFRSGARLERESRFVDSAGAVHCLYTVKVPVYNEAGDIHQCLCVAVDLSKYQQDAQVLFEEKERAQRTLQAMGEAVITTDARARVQYLNPVAEALTGWSSAEAHGRPLGEVFRVVREQGQPKVFDPATHCLQETAVVRSSDGLALKHRSGVERDITHSAAPIRARDGQVLGTVLVVHDVTESRRLTRKLSHEATHDSLTGLVNRREFEQRLRRALDNARQHGTQHALCYVDLDGFKAVNDSAGHAAGDELLKHIHALLGGMFRERDTLARIGGDEFGLLLDHCPLQRARVIAEGVVRNIGEHRFHWQGRSYRIGASVGLVPITAISQSTDQLLNQADAACYVAKEMGRNRVHTYRSQDSERTPHTGGILSAAGLREALEQRRFRLYQQPIVPLHTADAQPFGYEMLLRVLRKGRAGANDELVLPAAFLPAAERYGLMSAIDRWVIEETLSQSAQTHAAGIAINLSGHVLSDEGLLDFVQIQLAAHAVRPERICFEIPGAAALRDLNRVHEVMNAFRRYGIRLALDDFAGDLSALRQLRALPLDYLKIDCRFISHMHDQTGDCALVEAINQVSHTMGIQTIAVCVHNGAIAQRLRDLGVDFGQGYHFGQPVPWSRTP
jgi:diguanylate cyclase (GGDEF)-like protein/PAS domain S-box-containing protein